MAKKAKSEPVKAARGSDQFMIRLPGKMRQHLAELADRHGRSMNAEVVTALAVHFAHSTIDMPIAPEEVPPVYELLFKIGNATEHLLKEVSELKSDVAALKDGR